MKEDHFGGALGRKGIRGARLGSGSNGFLNNAFRNNVKENKRLKREEK